MHARMPIHKMSMILQFGKDSFRRAFVVVLVAVLALCQSCSRHGSPDVARDVWQFAFDSSNVGIREKWYADSFDRFRWSIARSGYWSDGGGSDYDGAAWYASRFRILDTAQRYSVFFGGADDEADVWVNGTMVGSHAGSSESFAFDLPEVHSGENAIVVRVTDLGGQGGLYRPVQIVRSSEVKKLLKSRYANKSAHPSADWVRDAVIYEVYLRSFSHAGTFSALEERLPELRKLGVTVLWLMPIHPVGELARKGTLGSPYAVQDYYGINPEFGTLKDFQSLVASVHHQGMKIIIDLVANHSSWDSKLIFEHPEWFKKNREGAIVSPRPEWTDVAQLDYDQHELRKYMISVMKYWVGEIGIDGFRCDVADFLPIDVWEVARKELDKIRPVMMLAEGDRPEDHVSAFDLTYSWNLYDVLGDVIHGGRTVNVFDNLLERERLNYPEHSLRLRFDTNHDKTVQDGPPVRKYTKAGAEATAALIFTYPGIPLVYNGEEVGNAKKLDLFEKVDIDWKQGATFREEFTLLASIRKAHPALRMGDYERVSCTDSTHVYAFRRMTRDDEVTVVVNFSDQRKNVSIQGTSESEDLVTRTRRNVSGKKIALSLKPYGYAILVPYGKDAKQ